MSLTETTITIPYKGDTLQITAFIQKRSSEYLLLLHGIQSNKELFMPLLEQTFVSKYSFIAIDCIGFGNSSKPETFSYDVEEQAQIITEILKQLEIEKVHIIGHSLGGVIGTILLDLLKEKVQSFINLEGNLTLADSSLSKTVAGYSFAEFKNEKYAQIQNDLKESHEPSAKWRSKWLQSIPDYAFYKTSRSLIDWAKSGKLVQRFAQGSGKKAYMLGDKNMFKKALVPEGIETITIANSGHFMLLDNPEECFAAIERFLVLSY